jgi:DNA-binding transcriptional MerR regulator
MSRGVRRSTARGHGSGADRGANSSAPASIPERGLKIGEAARALGVETYVLRFWETQFPFLKPRHVSSKHRFYGEREMKVLRLIRRLLHEQGFTIAGANKYIREQGLDELLEGRPSVRRERTDEAERRSAEISGAARHTLAEVRRDLESIHKLLSD